jgi:protein O-mannosyl-transferase
MTKKIRCIIAASVALVTLLMYFPALHNGFVGIWDDNAYVVEDPHIRSLDAAFFRWAFLDFHVSNWHPLTWISHAVDYALWGLNPLGHHLTNIVLHAVNTALVVMLALMLLDIVKKRSVQNRSTSLLNDRTVLIAAGVTGLLFGIHPVHVESVAWVAERKDLLCALFFLLSVMAYVRYVFDQGSGARGQVLEIRSQESGVRSQKSGTGKQESGVRSQKPADSGNAKAGPKKSFLNEHYLFSLGFFVLALMSKPMAVTLPMVLLILDWYPFNRIQSIQTLLTAGIEKLPFLALSLASSIIAILAQSAGESIESLELIPFSTRLLVAAKSLIAYLGKMLLPLNLIPFYPYPKDAALFSFPYASAIILAAGITVACIVLAKKQRLWLSAWGYYVVTLIPVLGIVQVGNQAMADRYTYLPSIGPFLITGLCAAGIAEKARFFSRKPFLGMIAPLVAAIVVFFSLAASTVQQIGVWKNGFVLWDHVIAKGFESATAYNNRGLSMDEMGQRDKAIADFSRAISMEPGNYFAYNNMGVMYGKDGQYQRSIDYFLKAISINPEHTDSYCNLGLSYFYLKQYDIALENYNKAIGLKRNFDAAYLNRGNLYFTVGNKELAFRDYREACSFGNRAACEILRLASGV